MAIPKLIVQTFSDWSDLNPAILSSIALLQQLNRSWQYRFYDDTDIQKFIVGYYSSDVLKSYERINPAYSAARADLFRYLVMYQFGGVYLDIKATATKELDQVLRADDSYLLSHWNDDVYKGWGKHPKLGVQKEFQQWHIIASPRHPYLKAVIKRVRTNIDRYSVRRYGVGKKAVWKVTGPVAYTLAIQAIQAMHSHRIVSIEDIGIRYSIFGNKDAHKAIFKSHYTLQKEPLILNQGRRFWFW